MKRLIAVFFVGGVLGTAAGFAIGLFVYPYIFLADQVAMEAPVSRDKTVVARGTFIHANPNDPVHYGKGTVTVYNDTVRLESDFEVGPGPKFHVYLVPKTGIKASSDVKGTKFVDLGRLRAFKGAQNFRVPAGVDPRKFGSVVIWCEAFGVLISPAMLQFEQATAGRR
jgi:hypothetical protein